MKSLLGDIAEIRFGVHASPADKGEVAYLQARQFDGQGKLLDVPGGFLSGDTKIHHHLLADGDILLAGKGYRNFAWRYSEETGPAVASSIFFVIRPDKKKIDPDYLATVLNSRQSQVFFQQLGAGTKINSIRKSELGAFAISLPPPADQKRIAELSALHQQTVDLGQKLLQLKTERFEAIINKLVNT